MVVLHEADRDEQIIALVDEVQGSTAIIGDALVTRLLSHTHFHNDTGLSAKHTLWASTRENLSSGVCE